ncbi:MAG: prepilin-type N-terminal cleavage/methylation domain protein [Massilia sp.]|jgi:type IV fimbrial biogenesis protein FimT|nr:prepilin-type N-terminal cleavage/methylation domain protein [Massilia sp.]MDB5951108.1 prepilin-type N-terminal cleavage/methylation domain protein [Massilia sp.]
MIELVVVLGITSTLLLVGVPSMSNWVMANKAAAAGEFYMEGFRMARQQAIAHNTTSRIVLSANQTTGQLDWQVDLCFADLPATPCTGVSSNWSTVAVAAAGDPEGGAGFKSIRRSADNLPSSNVISPTLSPAGAFFVYYNALGWVDTSFNGRLTRLQLDPLPAYAARLPTTAIVVTLSGMPARCDVGVAVTDSRGCPP